MASVSEAMVTAYVGIGSNLGDRVRTCQETVAALGRLRDTRLLAVSPLYETEPEEGAGPRRFVNAVVALETDLAAEPLLAALQHLEALAGRPEERIRGKNRTLDLDLLLYGDVVCEGPSLTVPHPRLHRRRFVLEPLCAVAPDVVHPTLGRLMREVLAALGPSPSPRRLEVQVTPGPGVGETAGFGGAA